MPDSGCEKLTHAASSTMTAAAKTGYVFINWTYGIGGTVAANTKVIKFVMQTNLVLTANFIVPGGELPFDDVADVLAAPQIAVVVDGDAEVVPCQNFVSPKHPAPQAIVVDGATEDWANVARASLTADQDVAAVINGNNVALLLTGCPFGATDTFVVAFKLRLTYGEGDNRHVADLWTSGSALYGMMDGKAIDGLEAVLAGGVLEVQFPVAGDAPSKVTIEEVGCMMDLGAGMTEVFGVTLPAVN